MNNYFDLVSGPNFKPAPQYDVIEFEPTPVPVDSGIIVEERPMTAREVLLFAPLRVRS